MSNINTTPVHLHRSGFFAASVDRSDIGWLAVSPTPDTITVLKNNKRHVFHFASTERDRENDVVCWRYKTRTPAGIFILTVYND